MAQMVRIEDFKAAGIELLSPFETTFDLAARSLFRGDVAELLKQKPFLTVVTNSTKKTIVAFTLEWATSGGKGGAVTRSQHKYPDAVAACPVRGNEIRPGEQRLVPRSIELSTGLWGAEPTDTFYLEQYSNWVSEQVHVEDLRIAIDAVLFEDGSLLGPDKSDLGSHFTAYFDAKQKIYREIVAGLDSGLSLEEASSLLDALRAGPPNLAEPLSIYARLAAQDASQWLEEFGPDSSNLFRQAVLPNEFHVRRLSELR